MRVTRIIASPYTRAHANRRALRPAVQPARDDLAPGAGALRLPCDVGSPVRESARRWPHHDFGHLPDIWWPAETESERAILARAAQFHVEMAARPDHAETLVVSHWGFILAMTGRAVTNCEWVVTEPDGAFAAATDRS